MAQDHLAGQRVPCPACGCSLLIQNPTAPRTIPQPSKTLKVACVCGRTYQPGPELAGRSVRCTACGNVLQIPALPGTLQPQYQPQSQAALTLPQRTILPATMQRPARASRSTGTRNPEASEQLTLRIVIGIAIAVCLLAVVGGIGFAVLPMTRQLADRDGDSDDMASSSDATSSQSGDESARSRFETADPPAAATAGDSVDSASTSNDATYGPHSDRSSNPFETPSDEDVSAASNDATVASDTASTNYAGTPAADFSSGSSQVARSGVGKALDLVGSMNAWHDQPNRDLTGIRRISGDNLAVYAHYSWMTELLPHLGHQATYDKFDFSESWLDDKNLQLSGELIPQFQNPGDNRQRWKGYPFDNMALTHFVGMAGLEDRRNVVAAKLPRSDPRAGIFGYDDVAKRDEIIDGESNTIMLIGGGKLASPWVAGGGATVRGAREPYFDELTGFGSQGGQSGAITVMADGSVRHISASIDPAAFRSLSTIHGGESVDVSKWLSDATLTK
ncbi:MAG: DUF1559 domain-containing protein [Planctomycetota bacterium]